WNEIAKTFALDPDGLIASAIASRDAWSGITVSWPVDGGDPLPVELAGLPVSDRMRQFAGYRGFGVCRDLDGLARLAALRRYEFFGGPPAPQPLSAEITELVEVASEPSPVEPSVASPIPELPEPIVSETPSETVHSE